MVGLYSVGMGQQTLPTDDSDDGRWLLLPSAQKAAAHATPFPDFGIDAEVGMAVHDINVAQMTRIAEDEH